MRSVFFSWLVHIPEEDAVNMRVRVTSLICKFLEAFFFLANL